MTSLCIKKTSDKKAQEELLGWAYGIPQTCHSLSLLLHATNFLASAEPLSNHTCDLGMSTFDGDLSQLSSLQSFVRIVWEENKKEKIHVRSAWSDMVQSGLVYPSCQGVVFYYWKGQKRGQCPVFLECTLLLIPLHRHKLWSFSVNPQLIISLACDS